MAEAHQLPSVLPAGPGVSAVVQFCIVPVLPVCWVALFDSRQGNELLWQPAGLHWLPIPKGLMSGYQNRHTRNNSCCSFGILISHSIVLPRSAAYRHIRVFPDGWGYETIRALIAGFSAWSWPQFSKGVSWQYCLLLSSLFSSALPVSVLQPLPPELLVWRSCTWPNLFLALISNSLGNAYTKVT